MFDKIIGAILGKGDQTGAAGEDAGLFGKISGALFGEGGVGSGLKGMMEKFNGSGLGDTFKSWVGTGENLPVSADQIGKVFDGTKLSEWAAKAGVSVEALKEKIATHLPTIVDKLTPKGQIDQE